MAEILLIGKILIILTLVGANIYFDAKNMDGEGYGIAAFLLVLWWIQ